MTGQIIIRDAGSKKDGKSLVMIVGVLALTDEEKEQLLMEHQYTLASPMILVDPIDLTQKIGGMSLGSLVVQPLWRI